MTRARIASYVVFVGIAFLTIVLAAPSQSAVVDPDTIIAAWLLDDDDDDIAEDSSGNERHAQIVGAPEVVDGKFGKALDLNGLGDVLAVEGLALAAPGITNELTMAAWVRVKGVKNQDLFFFEPGAPWENRWGVHMPWDGVVYFQYGNPFSTASFGFKDEWVDTWVHWAFTAGPNEQGIYRDGEVGSQLPKAAPLTADERLWHVGGRSDSSLEGTIDDVIVFGVILSPEQIQTLMAAGLEGALAVSPSGKAATTWASLKAHE